MFSTNKLKQKKMIRPKRNEGGCPLLSARLKSTVPHPHPEVTDTSPAKAGCSPPLCPSCPALSSEVRPVSGVSGSLALPFGGRTFSVSSPPWTLLRDSGLSPQSPSILRGCGHIQLRVPHLDSAAPTCRCWDRHIPEPSPSSCSQRKAGASVFAVFQTSRVSSE